jgi:eukaryotic-like serine/threonine-protein kinase
MQKSTPSSRVIRIGAFELDPATGELTRNGRKTQLTVQLLQVLLALLENPGELVTREELVRRLWPSGTFVDFDHSLNKAVNKLREALGDSAEQPKFIETFPRRGYRLIAPVEREKEEPEPPIASPAAESTVEGIAASTSRRIGFRYFAFALAAGCLGLVIVAVVPGWRNAILGRVSAHTLTDRDTILVADFVNKTGDSVFDDALKEGLLADLGQSPFLSILSDGTVRQQLRYMGRPAETPLTPDIAREVCRRANSKAMLLGSITGLGTHYAITLKAVACEDGNAFHIEQQEADRREHVLAKLHVAARAVRGKLGESLASIQKHDTPLFEDTTSSLEALEAYGVAMKTWRSKGEAAALPMFKRAVELDPKFAVANTGLAVIYSNLGQPALSAEYATRAFHLRDRVTELERFSIDSAYYLNVTGEQEKAVQVNQQWRQIYPRALAPRINLAFSYANLGQLEKALAEDLGGLQLNPNTSLVYSNLFSDYASLDRLQDAAAILEQARLRKLDESMLANHYQLAFLRDDAKEMARCLSAAIGTGGESSNLAAQSDTEAFHGRLQSARDLSRRAVDSALHADGSETAAGWLATEALREGEFGNTDLAKKKAVAALALASTTEVQIAAAIAMARAGEEGRSQALLEGLRKRFPTNTLVNGYWLPSISAALALHRHDAAVAVRYLEASAPYELGGGRLSFSSGGTMYPVYLRGEAFLQMRKWSEAAAEFQKILNHRGLIWNFSHGALAHLQLARAYAGMGDTTNARKAFGNFFLLWHDADPNVPILRQAKAEFAKLK